jgi:preprotein translocase subunit SecY
MERFTKAIKTCFTDPMLRKKLLFVVGAFFIFRLLANIPVPSLETGRLEQLFAQNDFLGLLNIFSGGGLNTFSLVMLGVGPYITASIILQLCTMMSPRLKSLYHEEGEAGRRKFIQYSRLLTVPLAILQAYGYIMLLANSGVLTGLTGFEVAASIMAVVTGSILLMWIGELITEFGVGNGTSLIIFAGIVAGLPAIIAQLGVGFEQAQAPLLISFAVAAVLIILGSIYITEAERPVPVTHAKQARNGMVSSNITTYIPLRMNQAGVMPIIFALSILLFPQMAANFLSGTSVVWLQKILAVFTYIIQTPWLYAVTYFVLVVLFTFFYTAVTFEPHTIAENLQKSGSFIPGVRPGAHTGDHIGRIMTRITLVGAIFLGLIAVLPIILQSVTGIQALALGGTSLLIVVNVVTDLIKKIDAQVSMREY